MNIRDFRRMLPDYDIEDALHLLGLSRRRSAVSIIVPALGLLAAGAAIGAGIGLAFAPSSGRRFREDMGGRIDHLRERVKRETAHAQQKYNEVNASS
jgi:hypothetical protein